MAAREQVRSVVELTVFPTAGQQDTPNGGAAAFRPDGSAYSAAQAQIRRSRSWSTLLRNSDRVEGYGRFCDWPRWVDQGRELMFKLPSVLLVAGIDTC
jgi:hypothetical protein